MGLFLFIIFCIFIYGMYVAYKTTDKSNPHSPTDDEYTGVNWQHQRRPYQVSSTVEGSFSEITNPNPADIFINIAYTNFKGMRSKRTVNISEVDKANNCFTGRCLYKDERRTFNLDRVDAATDSTTGEVITDFYHWYEMSYRATPKGQAEILLADHADVLKTLLYVAKADGRLTAKELAVLAEKVTEITTKETSAEVIKLVADKIGTQTIGVYKLAVGRLTKSNLEAANKTMQAAQRLIDTQTTTHPSEKEAFEYFQKKLLSPADTSPKSAKS